MIEGGMIDELTNLVERAESRSQIVTITEDTSSSELERVAEAFDGQVSPATQPALARAQSSDERAPVDVVLLAKSSVLLCRAMAHLQLDLDVALELREEIIIHLDDMRRAMRATGRLGVYTDIQSSIFHAEGSANA